MGAAPIGYSDIPQGFQPVGPAASISPSMESGGYSDLPAGFNVQAPPSMAEWKPYLDAAAEAEKAHGLPSGSVAGILHGEMTRPGQVSSAGAITPLQVLPSTARDMGMDPKFLARNPAAATFAGAAYLAKQYKAFGNLKDAYAAYNGGPGGALKWIAAGRPSDSELGKYSGRAFGGAMAAAHPGGDLSNVGAMTLTAVEQGAGQLAGLPSVLTTPNPATVADIYSRLGPGAQRRMQATSNMPFAKYLPTSQEATDFLTRQAGNVPYEAQSAPGRIYQGAVRTGTSAAPFGLAGAGYGALSGAGSQAAQELNLPPAVQTVIGLGLPLIAGAGIPALKAAVKPLTGAGQSAIAQSVLDRAALNPRAAIEAPPISMPATLGQSTNDPGLLGLERTVEMRSPENQGAFNAIRQGQQAAVNQKLTELGNFPGHESGAAQAQIQNASQRGAATLHNAYDAARQNEHQLWNAVDPTNSASIATQPIIKDIKNFTAGLTRARSRFIPSDISDMVASLKPRESLAELQDTRSAMLSRVRELRAANNDNAANVVEGLAKTLGNRLDSLPMSDPEMAARYQAARQASAQLHDQFGDQITTRVMAKNAQGLPAVPPSQILSRYLNGTPEGLSAYLKATGGTPEAIQAAKDHVIAGLKLAAQTTQPAASGGYSLSASQFTKYMAKNQALFSDARLFSPAERDILQRSGMALDFIERTARAGIKGGSDTYAKIAGGKYLEPLLGKKALAFLKLSGAAIGGITHGIPGAVGGYLAAERAAVLYKNASDNIMKLVDGAVKSPVAAAELRRFSKTPGVQTMTPAVRQLLGTP